MIEINVNGDFPQSFSTVISGAVYQLTFRLNVRGSYIMLDASNGNGEVLFVGMPLVGGVDLTEGKNLPFSNMYAVNLDNTRLDPTNKVNLVIFDEGEL